MNIIWQRRFLELAKSVAAWSKDPSRQVGAVIVNPDTRTILSLGYNGFPRNIEDTPTRLNDRDIKYKYVVHAEMNAIYNASFTGTSLRGAHMFIYGLPICNECAKAVIQVGIERIVMPSFDNTMNSPKWVNSWETSQELFREAKVSYQFIT